VIDQGNVAVEASGEQLDQPSVTVEEPDNATCVEGFGKRAIAVVRDLLVSTVPGRSYVTNWAVARLVQVSVEVTQHSPHPTACRTHPIRSTSACENTVEVGATR
jgi:hypothetical protein